MKIPLALLGLALVLIAASIPLEPYRLAPDGSVPMYAVAAGNSEAYFAARAQALTAKYDLQDYGITLLLCALILAAIRWQRPTAPRARLGFHAWALAAPIMSTVAGCFDLVQASTRLEYPPWGDSLGIPLMGLPMFLLAGFVWSLSHCCLLAGVPRRAGVALSLAAIRHANAWLILVCVVTALIVAAMAAAGAYWYVLPGVAWMYFYASLAAVRHARSQPTVL